MKTPSNLNRAGAKKHLLAVSFAFPPIKLPRSIQVARLLSRVNLPITVVAAEWSAGRVDHSVFPNIDDHFSSVHRVPFEVSTWRRTLNRILYRVHRKEWNRLNAAPDEFRSWTPGVMRQVKRLVTSGEFRPDVVVTFGKPFTSHLIGRRIKSELGIPWFALFSDPWADNLFNQFDEHGDELNRALEEDVIANADALGMNSRETVELMLKKYPEGIKEKAHIIPHAFDSSLYPSSSDRPNNETLIRYVGEFYGKRKPDALLKAIHALAKKNNALLSNIRFEFVGLFAVDEETNKLMNGLPDGLVSVKDAVDYLTSLKLMKDSDGLLVVDAPTDLSVFLPSKLVDYIGAGRPIFGITPKGTASNLIAELGGITADPKSESEVMNGLEDFIELLRSRRNTSARSEWGDPLVRRRFEPETIARDFEAVIDKITSGS